MATKDCHRFAPVTLSVLTFLTFTPVTAGVGFLLALDLLDHAVPDDSDFGVLMNAIHAEFSRRGNRGDDESE